MKQLLVESHRASRVSVQASRGHEQLKALNNTELKQMMVSQRLRYEQSLTDMQNAIKAKDSKIDQQNDMLHNFRKKLQGGGGDRNRRGRGSTMIRGQSPHLVPPDNNRVKQMMASQQRRHEQTISDLENAIKAKDSKIAEQNDSLSYFSDSTKRLMSEINQLNQMMESQSLQFEETMKDKDSEISDI